MATRSFGPVLTVVAIALVASVPAAAQEPGPLRTVLTVHWSSEDFPVTPIIDAAIRDVFRARAGSRIDYHAEYLESDRFPAEEASLALRDYIRRKFTGRRIDVVIAISEAALRFVLRHRDELFPLAAIVSSTIGTPADIVQTTGAGMTGVVSRTPDLETVELALALHPDTRRVFVVAQSPPGQYLESLRRSLEPIARRVELTYINEPMLAGLMSAIRDVPAGSLILFVRHSQETPGEVLFPRDVAQLAAAVAPVPMYAAHDRYIGTGIVGGVVRMTPAIGSRVGEIVLQILDGARAADIPFEEVPLATAFDWRAVRRWGVDAAVLPPGASIQFREPSVWEEYRWYIIGTIGLVAVQGLMIFSLVLHRARRREVEARNGAILRAAPDMMFLLTRDGVFVDYHAPDDSWLLMKPTQFLERHMREVFPPDVASTLEACCRTLAPGQPPARFEYRLQMPQGERHFEARVVPCRETEVLAVVREITDRKRAEAALTDSRERYARATAAGRVAVWDWDLDTNEIYADPVMKAMLGYEAQRVGNYLDDWLRLVHPDDVPAVLRTVHEHIDDTEPLYEVEYRMYHRDGSIRWFLARGSVVRRDGRPWRVIGTNTDITELRKAEHALQTAQADLTRLSRLTALGEFAASIAHEVRQPLTAIMANAKACFRWLGSDSPDIAEIRDALLDVVAAGQRADEMIQRNRELFNHRTVDKVPLDLAVVFKETAVLAKGRLQSSGITLALADMTNVPYVLGDTVGLQQVLLNLISNSIDAMDGTGGARRIDVSASITPDGMVAVAVRDTGVGLTTVDRERMFDLSYTTKQTGTGVGLAISRAIVEAHGGELTAVENADGGATFSFTVPIVYTAAMVSAGAVGHGGP